MYAANSGSGNLFYRLYELKVEKDVSESQQFEMCMSSGSKTPKTYLIVL